MDIGPWELLIILVIVLVLFGGAKLPGLARSLGQAQKEFKKGMSESHDDEDENRKSK
jgi:sec-independent protein translocase protein TatA